MASVLAGARPVKHRNGSPYNGQVNRYTMAAADGGAANVGDFVVAGSGDAIVGPGGGVYPVVTRATSGTSAALVGVIVGFEPDYANLNAGHVRLASTARVALVADADDIVFAVPQDAVGGVIAAASVGLNVPITLGTAQIVAPFASQMSVDSSAVATTATLPLRIVGITDSPDQDVTSTARPAEILVTINTHAYANGIAGV